MFLVLLWCCLQSAAVLGVLDEIGADEVIISREQRPGVGEAIGSPDRLEYTNHQTTSPAIIGRNKPTKATNRKDVSKNCG